MPAAAPMIVRRAALPYSVEPMEEWQRPEGYWLTNASSRPAFPGWSESERQEVAALTTRERELATRIVTHAYWSELPPGDVPEARSRLKHATHGETAEAGQRA